MKHKILLVVLGLVLLTLYLGCQKDDGSESTESSTDIQDVISRRLPFEVIPHFTKVDDKINKLRIKLNTKGEVLQKSLDIDSVTIRTDEILYMTYAQTHTYTFKLLRTNPQYYIENIVLHYNVDTESYDEYLVQYDINQQEFLDIYSGSYVGEESKAIITDLDSGTVSTILSKSGCRRTCETISVNCSASGNHAPGQACNTGVSIDQWAYTYESCTTTCTEEEDASIDPGPSGGGGGGGNSAVNTNPEPNEPCERIINGQTYVGIIDTEGNCITVDDEDENEGQLITSVDQKNCEELNKLIEIPNYPITPPSISPRQAIINLKNEISNTIDPNNNLEQGYNLLHNANLQGYANPVSNPSSRSIRYKFIINNYGGLHLHPNDGDGHPFFSPEDILNLWKFYDTYDTGNITDPSLFVHVLVSTKGVYAIKIDNPLLLSQLGSIYNDYLDANEDGTDEVKEFGRPLKNAYRDFKDFASGHPTGSDSDYQHAFLKFMNNFNNGGGIGISLYKASEDLTNWTKLTLNDSDIIEPNPCN
ncbi:hypothetical protein [Winogradskyella sp. SYSU M77433]|uniref:hypothetical protein n=1 Tax=Winogradskyella sp. SYSU M77433 TaxID=3042722 RepID=UPI00248083C8|nr:hypothetical protein [Winogradskyella sp. SYSU M77433]MDH7912126.1 hypothetical protein [Winogradskyella sp. SYSU M77433]